MGKHIIFWLFLLMVVGYVFIELARYRRSREKEGDPLDYPRVRLVLRTIIGTVLVAFLGIVVYLKPFYGGPPEAGTYALSALAVLLVFLVADFFTVYRQFRKARSLREQQFLNDVSSLVTARNQQYPECERGACPPSHIPPIP